MLNYSAVAINVPFDSDYKNVIDFGTEEEKRGYFSELIGDTSFSPLSNFNVGNGIDTTVVYDAPKDFTLFQQLNANYLIIKDNSDNYFYYFIKNCEQLSANRFKYSISIDIFTQYFNVNYFTDTKYLIQRAHLDRFNKDTSISDYMFSTPPIKVDETYNKYIYNDIYLPISGSPKMPDGTIGWKYIFIHNYKTYNNIAGGEYTMTSEFGTSEFGLIVEPIVNDGVPWKFRYVGLTTTEVITYGDFFENRFRKNNNNASFIYDIKILPYPPFDLGDERIVSIDLDNRIIEYRDYFTPLLTEDDIPALTHITLTPQFQIGKITDLILKLPTTYLRDKDYYSDSLYPKLYDGGKSLTLGYFTQEFTINIMRFLTQIDLTSYNPPLFDCVFPVTTIDGSILITIGSAKNIKYAQYISKYYGLFAKMDSSIQVSNDQYSLYVANNKNFNLQFDSNMKLAKTQYVSNLVNKTTKTVNDFAKSSLSGDVIGGIGNGLSNITQLITSAIAGGVELSNIENQFNYEIDNYKGAPSTISTGQPHTYLQLKNKVAPYVANVDILPQKKQSIVDNWRLYGYYYNKLDTIAKWHNSRKYHNYVQAIVEDITAPWSIQVKELFKLAFSRGVRFWHYNNGDWNGIEQYVNNNYERIFDDV